ncbi:Eco57I restriction-modification methylase domain-containing protein [Aporhodopirellula aestuarii]|uniref:site-specific DNA-methyltransferase (adenine-specific) n=1 Tax=Aporhodopirellula aestuarii TaxID=2950107 RepID=A0ABT0U153_9BACT|nr:N-6 DNA methylase [Aporhodopirellula aestuarii]MCM2370624.1 N-6 DNA methylase [Aporhodopirellula aestuarii]
MAKSNSAFQTIRTEGALFPPDILQRIASLKVNGTRVDDYHLPPGFKVKEAITASWTALRAHWTNFQEARANLDGDDTGTAITNDRWLLPLFKELDYGRLTTDKAPVIDEKTYPIERFYNNTPIHLIGCNLGLDRRTKGARGAATASPHSMMQEFLNRSDDHLWAFVSNGTHLRILRDNISLSRQAFVEFDLEAMMEGEVYSDFALLWLLCHQSRVEADQPEQCWLEKWSQLAREQGTRILKDLRGGVEKSIEALGQGFISHPRNDQLREKLQSGELTKDDYYRQLLRIVYRLLFLFVAEDRELLHPSEVKSSTAELYDTYYSTRRLREMSQRIRGSKHADLWHSLSLVFDSLSKDDGCPQLGLIGLGSFLWRSESTVDLNGPAAIGRGAIAHGSATENTEPTDPVYISNDDLLHSIRALAYVEQDRVLRSVDYRNLGSEELGSVYESLLELHPQMHVEAKTFSLNTAAGNERKTTGSYYTPDSLVQCLLDSALEPVVEQRLKDAKTISRRTLVPGSLPDDLPDWIDRIPADRRDVITSGNYTQIAEQAILALTVCDPACGSGHFLIAAAHRLARQLARVRTGESEPSPEDHQHALRDIIGRCIYGVDINPMAVELCKVSLWMEAIEPGKPLSFLDHHIQCGNSLLGTTPELLAAGIPNDAFKPIEGDDKEVCKDLKKRNARERSDAEHGGIQQELWNRDDGIKLGNMAETFARLSAGDDDTVEAIRQKELEYAKAVRGDKYKYSCLLADLWCAAFLWKKDETDLGRLCPTQYYLKEVEKNPHSIPKLMETEVQRLAQQYAIFHWYMAFPDVFVLPNETGKAENHQTGWSRGFDVVLGNPPWERVVLKEKEFFAERNQTIADARTASRRRKLIAELRESDPKLFEEFSTATRKSDGESQYLRLSGQFPLCGGGRDINSAFVFAELLSNLVATRGRNGVIVPSAIVTDHAGKLFFKEVVESDRLVHVYDFENNKPLFAGVHRSYKFALLCISGASGESVAADFAFFMSDVNELGDALRHFRLSAFDIAAMNPNSRTCPVFRRSTDAELTRHVYARLPVITNEALGQANDWKIKTRPGLFHTANDSAFFHTADGLQRDGFDSIGSNYEDANRVMVPLYESKMVHQFDHRWLSFCEGAPSPTRDEPTEYPVPRYWVPESEVKRRAEGTPAQLLVRRITRSTDERSLISALIPEAGISDSATLLVTDMNDAVHVVGVFNSFAMDYFARQKLAGVTLSPYILRQFPIPSHDQLNSLKLLAGNLVWLPNRVLELTFTAWDLEAFALDFGYKGPPFRWDEERRFRLRCELDAAYFHLYMGEPEEWGADNSELRAMFHTPRDAVEYIMETFPIVKRKDIARTEVKNEAGEVVTPGTYVTKDTILEIYDEMATAIATGVPYQTRLDPPPGPPTDEAGNFIPMAQWDQNNWPSHIHPPRGQKLIREDTITDIMLLLHHWDIAVHVSAIELGVLFMRDDRSRQIILDEKPVADLPPETERDSDATHLITHFDLLYYEMAQGGLIESVGENAYQIKDKSAIEGLSEAYFDKAREAVEAVKRFDRPEETIERLRRGNVAVTVNV